MSATKYDQEKYLARKRDLIDGIVAELKSRGFEAWHSENEYGSLSTFTISRGALKYDVTCGISQHYTGGGFGSYSFNRHEFPAIEVHSSPRVTYKPDLSKGTIPNVRKVCDRLLLTWNQIAEQSRQFSERDDRLRDCLRRAVEINGRLGVAVVGVSEHSQEIKLELHAIPPDRIVAIARLLIDSDHGDLLAGQDMELARLERRLK